jgi:basic membrane protein A
MYDEGADVIFQIAGGCGIGVFEAAQTAQKYTIGVDEDQKALAPEFTLASMRKRIGDSLYQFMDMYLKGEVNRGETYYFGLANDGVGLDYGDIEPDLVPQDVKDKVEELRQMIIDGEIVVDSYRE